MYVGQNLLSANGIRMVCPLVTMGGHVIPIHTCEWSLPYVGFPYKGRNTHLGAFWNINIKQGISLIVKEKYQCP